MTYLAILATLTAYRAALPMAHKLPPGRIKDAIVSILGAGGPGAVPR